ncbi:hypothetical protein VLK31_07170 [Variovorax sp. H27-G14]|uniref:hypothetical protein n=1 Tax=Variovorax sp. H27-G14 TaxID=3111914 RepID=UPI0038FD2BE2
MSNALYRAGNFYTVPAVPYQPARAAYTWSETLTGTRVVVGNSQWIRVQTALGGSGRGSLTTLIYTGPVTGNGGINETFTYAVLHEVPGVPEVPGSPAYRVDNPPQGWTSFARTVAAAFGFCQSTFKVRDTVVGAAVGLSSFDNPTAGYGHIPHGLLFTGGQIKNLRTGAVLDSFVADDTFAIRNYGGSVTFYKNGASIGSESSTYGQETLRLAAVLYAADDFVSDPALVAMGAGSSAMQMPGMQMAASNYIVATSAMTLPALTVQSNPWSRAAMSLPLMGMLASQTSVFSQAALSMPRLGLLSYGGALGVMARSSAVLALPTIAGQGILLVGQTGSAAMARAPLAMIAADRPYAAAAMVLPRMTMEAHKEPDDFAYMLEGLRMGIGMSAQLVDVASMPIGLAFGIGMDALVLADAAMPIGMLMDVPMSASTVTTGEMAIRMLFDLPLAAPADDVDVWAVNLATNGSTSYSGFVFNSFANIGGRYFGSNADGIFELDGDDDAGTPIDAAISLGAKDFGSAQKKTLVECFVTMAGPAPLYMKLRAEGREFVYQTQSYSDELQLQRFKFGKGKALQANYLTPIIYNVDGEDFELEGIQFAVADLQRKL